MLGRRSQQSKQLEQAISNSTVDTLQTKIICINTNRKQSSHAPSAQDKPKNNKKVKLSQSGDASVFSTFDAANEHYNLRQKSKRSYLDFGSEAGADDNDVDFGLRRQVLKERKNSELNLEETIEYDKLPKNKAALQKLLLKVEASLEQQKMEWFKEQFELPTHTSSVPDGSVPINADVLTFDFKKLARDQQKLTGQLFDVIMMDPPWQLSTSQPSRGVAIAYSSLKDDVLFNLPINILQKEGFIFIWAINAKYRVAAKMIKEWGYTLLDEIIWVKRTVNGKIAKGHGFYLQHAKENCLIGYKGNLKQHLSIGNDVIWSERRGQSQKPEGIYHLIEQLVPQGNYLEIFGRRNNLRQNWVTLGNEL